MRRTIGLVAAAVVLLAAAACGGGGDDDAGRAGRPGAASSSTGRASGESTSAVVATSTSTSTTASTTTTASTSGGGGAAGDGTESAGSNGSGSAGGARGCAANGGVVPDGAVSAPVVDVDGDGRRDQVWFSFVRSSQRVGIATASHLVVAATVRSAKGVREVVVVNADQRGPVELLAADGATAYLYVLRNCDLVPVMGPDDRPYLFDLGYRGNGTGVNCTDADGDGRRDLVGVNFVDHGDGTATLSRTVIELVGATARHGHHDERTVPGYQADPQQAAGYIGVHCGPAALTPEMIEG
jgi:hypothetical protein